MSTLKQLKKGFAEFDALSCECNAAHDLIEAEREQYDTAMHVMFFDAPPVEYMREYNARLSVLIGEYEERVARLGAYVRAFEIEFDRRMK